MYCDQPVCLSVCLCLPVREHISGTAGPIFTILCVQIPCGRGSILFRLCCDMLCTSGFMDDVTLAVIGIMAMRDDTGAECDVYECLIYSDF